jgi:phosphoenolpyruvate-protein kinase (PTS system EI component)
MRINYGLALIMSAIAGVAIAKLPALTPEQQDAAATKKQADQATVEKEKEALERAQNRVTEYYKRTKGDSRASAGNASRTETTNMSRKSVEGPGTTAPRGGTNQSAEAHSTPAK